MPTSPELPPILRTLRYLRIGLQELYLIALIVLAFAALFGLKHLA
jgi:hypothetical protein